MTSDKVSPISILRCGLRNIQTTEQASLYHSRQNIQHTSDDIPCLLNAFAICSGTFKGSMLHQAKNKFQMRGMRTSEYEERRI